MGRLWDIRINTNSRTTPIYPTKDIKTFSGVLFSPNFNQIENIYTQQFGVILSPNKSYIQ
jgi:hypothetical protein